MNKISIDLPNELLQRLTALAEGAGMSTEQYAAKMLIRELENGEANWIRHEIAKLREDIAISTQAILLSNCAVDEEKTRDWIAKELLYR